MRYGLDTKHAFAFGIDLQSQVATVQLEDCQIIRRSLDRDFPWGCTLFPRAVLRSALVAEDGLDGFQIQSGTAAVN